MTSATSLVEIVASHVTDLQPFSGNEVPAWIKAIELPSGWRTARMEGPGVPPARVALCGAQPDGGWDGCETVSAFRFTGLPPAGVMPENTDCTLRDLGAEDMTTCILPEPPHAGITAVRSSGILDLGGRRIWVQHSNYLIAQRGGAGQNPGLLVEQSIFVDAERRERLVRDIEQLTDALYTSILRRAVATGPPKD